MQTGFPETPLAGSKRGGSAGIVPYAYGDGFGEEGGVVQEPFTSAISHVSASTLRTSEDRFDILSSETDQSVL
jgi:hypothetical protein